MAAALVFVMPAMAQDGDFAGMANASVMQYGLWSAFNNQAGLGDVGQVAGGIGYQNRFELSETSTKTAAVAVATPTGNFALSYKRFGYSLYSENNIGLAYARHLGPMISVGLQFDYLNINQSDIYGSDGVFLFEVGIIARPISKLQIGAHIYNPTRAKMAEYEDERVNTSFRFGLGYRFSQLALLSIEAEKTMQSDMRVKTGLEYQLINNLYLRAGFRTEPNEFCFGAGYTLRSFTFNVAFATHQYLPMSTQLSLSYSL